MSGVGVADIVTSIIAAFGSGMNIFKRMSSKRKARRQDRQAAKLTQDELRLQQSLSRGPQQIRAEYDRSVTRLGHRFEIGDRIAHDYLAHTLIVLNTGLVHVLNHALSDDAKERDVSKKSLLGLSELATANTLNALGQLNSRLTSASSFAIQNQPQASMAHGRKKRAPKQKDQALAVSRVNSPMTNQKKRPEPDPLARGGWVRSKSGTSIVSSGSSTPRAAKHTKGETLSSPTNISLSSQPKPRAQNPELLQISPPCTCRTNFPTPRNGFEAIKHQAQPNTQQRLQEPDLLLVSPDIFNEEVLPPRPPKIPIERPASNRKARPPSVATFLTASTKIGEIPEHRWPDRPVLPWDNRPLPYVIPPLLESEPTKRKARGFKSWWKSHGRANLNDKTEALAT